MNIFNDIFMAMNCVSFVSLTPKLSFIHLFIASLETKVLLKSFCHSPYILLMTGTHAIMKPFDLTNSPLPEISMHSCFPHVHVHTNTYVVLSVTSCKARTRPIACTPGMAASSRGPGQPPGPWLWWATLGRSHYNLTFLTFSTSKHGG